MSIIYTASLTNGNWVDNVIIWYSSVMHQNQQYHSASLQWLHIMKSHMSQDSGIHHLHFTASDIPLQSFSDFRKVSRSPIITVRLLAAHATVATCTLPAEHNVPSFTSTAPSPPQICSERNYVTSKTETETENRFWPFPKPKNRFYRGNPVLETINSSYG